MKSILKRNTFTHRTFIISTLAALIVVMLAGGGTFLWLHSQKTNYQAPLQPWPVSPYHVDPHWQIHSADGLQDTIAIQFSYTHPAQGYVCGIIGHTLVVASTNNGGVNWSSPSSVLAVTQYPGCNIAIDPANSGHIVLKITLYDKYLSSETHIYGSVNNGQTWTQLDSAALKITNFDDKPVVFAESLVITTGIIAGSSRRSIFFSTDNQPLQIDLSFQNQVTKWNPISVAALGSNIYVLTNSIDTSTGPLYASFNEGNTWSLYIPDTGSQPITDIESDPSGSFLTIMEGIDNPIFWISSDGNHWSELPSTISSQILQQANQETALQTAVTCILPAQGTASFVPGIHSIVGVTPDGAVIAKVTTSPCVEALIMKPAGNSSSWKYLALTLGEVSCCAIQVDAKGNAIMLWAARPPNTVTALINN